MKTLSVTACAALLLLFACRAPASAQELEPGALYDKCAPSVVMVTAVETFPKGLARRTIDLLNPFPILDMPGDVLSFVFYPLYALVNGPIKFGGSGVIIDDSGHFLTNHHVIERGNVFWATLHDRRVIRAKLIGSDKDEDYALLKLELKKGEKIVAARLGDSAALRHGDAVAAIGSPLGLRQTLSIGVVAGAERRLVGGFQDFIQTDLTIGSGSSGGPLFNARGEVVGLTSVMIAAPMVQTGGVTFSIPINSVKEGLGQLKKKGRVTRGFIGAHVKDVTPRVAEKFKLSAKSGACIYEIGPTADAFWSPARDGGLQAGDVIVKYGDKPIDRARTLARAVLTTKPGTNVIVTFYRGKTLLRRTIKVTRR